MKPISVKWFDACSREVDEDGLKEIKKSKSGKEFLAINTTYGILYKKLEDVIVLVTEESDIGENEITVIPRGWIISPTRLK